MGRGLNRLTSLQIRNALSGKYADGGGLWLHKREPGPNGARQWFFRYTLHGRRREMGLVSIQVRATIPNCPLMKSLCVAASFHMET